MAPFRRLLDTPLARPRFNTFVIAVFAVTALLLTAVGLYAVMAASVRQRDVETLPEFRDEALASDEAFARYESDYRRGWRYDADPARVRPSTRVERLRGRLRDGFARVEKRDRAGVRPATYVATGAPRPTGVYGVYAERKDVEQTVERLREAGAHPN